LGLLSFGDKIVRINCKFKHCQGNGYLEIEDGQLAWFKKKGFDIPNTCDSCKRWKDSVSSQQIGCSKCGRNPRTFEPKQIIGANLLGDKSWSQVRSSHICTDCYRAEKKRLEPKVTIKCSFEHCLSPRGFFEMGQGEIDFLSGKGLTSPTSCKPCREWKKSITDQRIQCGTCRTNVDVAAKTIIYQQQNGDVNWQQFQRNFTCKDCKKLEGAIKLTCANNFCHQEQLTSLRTKQFLFTKSEQEFYKSKGNSDPTTCKPCREYKKTLNKQILKCTTCYQSTPIENYEIINYSNLKGEHWDQCKKTFECKGCIGFGDGKWYPSGKGWGWATENENARYRWKIVDDKVTDHMYADPRFNDIQAHAQHIHIFKRQSSGEMTVGFSYDVGSSPPSSEIMQILASYYLGWNDFVLNKEKTKYKLCIDSQWRLFYPERSNSAIMPKDIDSFDIRYELANKIMKSWKK
jgi:Probable zinc-ribbon domain